ncbi:MAG TPA: condensation domain-containing protein, partial [Thermoanaerobaculia bacterium]|nr:condensation domain-containing protein [Thermoanaerobaculia bacterium]
NFFSLGGHSLIATQLMSRVRQRFGVDLPLRVVFEAPTVAGLAQRIDAACSAEQGIEAPSIRPVPREGEAPLSFAQERLWFLDQLSPGSPLYNLASAFRLAGPLSVPVLERALAEIVRRHEVLRTAFPAQSGRPLQRIAPVGSLRVPVIDLGGLPAPPREMELQRRLQEEAQRAFDLARGPLLRACVLRIGPQQHIAAVTMHHIVSDGWSLGVLVREVAELYRAFSQGEGSPLAELPIQYADFAYWHRQWLQSDLLERQLAYWRYQLAGVPGLLDLPTDRPRPAVQGFRGRRLPVVIPGVLLRDLEQLGRRRGVTLFMTLLGSLAVLLHRYTHSEDLTVGSPVANRVRPEIEGLIGFFVNALVLRVDLSGEPSFHDLLSRVREMTLEAQAHQDLPFERLIQELQPSRSLGHTPLFQAVLTLQNAPVSRLEAPDLKIEPLELDTGTAKFDLTVTLTPRDEALQGYLEYSTELFDRATVERLLDHLKVLLAGIVADPWRRLSELALLSAGERHQMLGEWNDTAAAYPGGACLHELVAAQAARTPEAVAASFEGETLSYRELVSSARRLARHLVALGVEPDGRVGVLLERSLEMIVALLGVLEAGAAYMPLEPSLPAARLGALAESAGVSVILTLARHTALVPARGERVVVL